MRVVRSYPDLTPELADEWDDLVTRAAATPFHRPGWISAWWDAFGTGTLSVATVRFDGVLTAIQPLVEPRAGVLGSPANWHSFVFGPVAADADSLASLLKHVFTRPVGKVELSHLAAGDADIVCRAAYRHGCRVRTTTIQRSPFVPQGRSFEDYVQRRDRRRVRALGRNRERLQAAGDVTFTVHQDQDDLGDAVEQFFELEQCGWKSDAGTAILSDPATAQFYRAATRWAAEAGMLRVALLRVDGTPVAGELCIKDHRAVHALKAGYDPAFRRYTPGLLVQFDMIERALGAGLGYEFLGSAEPYKLNWADDVHDIDRLDVYPSTFAGSRAQLAELGVRAARRGVAVVGHAGAEAARRIRARQRQAVPSG